MKKPDKYKRKLLTDFYMWMVENDYNHNIRIRVETKAELFLRERIEFNFGVLADVVGRSEQLKCECKHPSFTRTVDKDYNLTCARCSRTL